MLALGVGHVVAWHVGGDEDLDGIAAGAQHLAQDRRVEAAGWSAAPGPQVRQGGGIEAGAEACRAVAPVAFGAAGRMAVDAARRQGGQGGLVTRETARQRLGARVDGLAARQRALRRLPLQRPPGEGREHQQTGDDADPKPSAMPHRQGPWITPSALSDAPLRPVKPRMRLPAGTV